MKIVFLQDNLQTQKFDQPKLLASLQVPYEFLTKGICVAGRCVRMGVLKIVRRECPDVILGYEASPVTLALLLFKKLRLIKAGIWTFMDDSPDQVRSRTGLRRLIRDWVVGNVDRVVVPSAQSAAAYRQFSPARFFVAPIIHDTDTIRVNADRVYDMGRAWRVENIPSGWSKVLLFVGRLTAIKNIPWLIDRMVEQPNDVGLLLVGDGDEEHLLKGRVETLGLSSRVMFVGRKEGDDLYAMMAMADCLVLCSHSETFGAVVAEAMQWGTPCLVAHHIGASVLVEDGVNGNVFARNDVEGFKTAVAELPARKDESILPCDLCGAVEVLTRTL